MDQYIHMLRDIAERMNVSPLKSLAMLPGVKAVYRVTIHYDKMRAADTIMTLRRVGAEVAQIETVYLGRFEHRPIVRQMPLSDYEAFMQAMLKAQFDRLPDQPDLPFYGSDIWLVERAASGFLKSVLMAPSNGKGQYAAIMAAVRAYIPEATREIS